MHIPTRLSTVIAALLLTAPGLSLAADCPTGSALTVKETAHQYEVPDPVKGASSVRFLKTGDESVLAAGRIANGFVTLDHGDLKELVKAAQSDAAKAEWALPKGGKCQASVQADTVSTADMTCREAVVDYQRKIALRNGKGAYALVVFCGTGETITTYGPASGNSAVGDEIFVAAYINDAIANPAFTVEPCSLRSAEPKRFGGLGFAAPVGAKQSTGAPPRMFPPEPVEVHRCFDPEVTVSLISSDKTLRQKVIKQYERYNFTAQLGAIRTGLVEKTYAVTDDGTGTTRIRDTGPAGEGPHYVAVLALYGVLHHLRDLRRVFPHFRDDPAYVGRDLVNDRGLIDRISGVFGVGLENPKEEFLAGLAVEIVPGVNILGTWRWVNLSKLDGFAVGDAYAGTPESIPRQDRWEKEFTVGLSYDLSYSSVLFNRQ